MNGAILAGGAGTRLGGVSKATVELDGRPLAARVAAVVGVVCDRVAVVCKRDTPLPKLKGIEIWHEPDEPRHPVVGIAHALERAPSHVLVCAVDMPWVTAAACRELSAAAERAGALAAIAEAQGRACPVFGVYAPEALEPLRDAPADAPLHEIVERLKPVYVRLPADVLRSVNAPGDLAPSG